MCKEDVRRGKKKPADALCRKLEPVLEQNGDPLARACGAWAMIHNPITMIPQNLGIAKFIIFLQLFRV
jgi:hypothetical protein